VKSVCAALALLVLGGVEAKPDAHHWDLTELYASEAAWDADREAIHKEIASIAGFRGTLGESPGALCRALDAWYGLDERLTRLYEYASMRFDLDQRVGRSQQMRQQAEDLRTELATASAWLRPEILALGAERVHAAVAHEPGLGRYRQPLEDMLRRAPHTLPPEIEKVVAQAGSMAGAGSSIREVFVNAELPFPEVELSTGEKVTLDEPAFTKYRASASREDRRRVFRAFFGAHARYARTLGTTLDAAVRAHLYERDVRGFSSCLEAALFADNIPVEVYSRLVEETRRNLPTLHRYLELRRRMMGLDGLGYEDLYAPIVPRYERTFTPEEASALTLAAVAPLGRAYQDALSHGIESGWVDWFPSPGKQSGAYSTSVYGVHPFQLQNFTGLYEEVSTLAHESGHSMHSYLADKTQPYATHDYPIFVAEVASTLHENLLVHSMLERAKTDDERLFLLGSWIDLLRTTLFRQTLFAEFERSVHEQVEHGEPLTGEGLTALYLDLVRTYYGHDRGVCKVDELYGVEWAYIPHFYDGFYVYQYATSVVASVSIADRIRQNRGQDDYLAMLSAGSSRYAFDLLLGAGVDLRTAAPYEAAFREMNRAIDQMQAIFERRKSASQ
jgi:oligoendopeptidase F